MWVQADYKTLETVIDKNDEQAIMVALDVQKLTSAVE